MRTGLELLSYSNDDELSYEVSDLIDQEKTKKRIDILHGFKTESNLDRLLLRDIFIRKFSKNSRHATNSDILVPNQSLHAANSDIMVPNQSFFATNTDIMVPYRQ